MRIWSKAKQTHPTHMTLEATMSNSKSNGSGGSNGSNSLSSSELRNKLRAQITGSPKTRARSVIIEFMDGEIELHQPSLGSILDSNDKAKDEGGNEAATILSMIENAYVPGTDEKVFEAGDYDWFRELPFGAELQRVMKALTELAEINFQQPDANSGQTPGASA
jgi:hypothetical protein